MSEKLNCMNCCIGNFKHDLCDCDSEFCNKYKRVGTGDDFVSAVMSRGWIPCSERLPEVGSEVLVCYDFKGNRSVYLANFYGDGNFHGYDDEYLTTEGRKYRKAIAWMPLPDVYKGDAKYDE